MKFETQLQLLIRFNLTLKHNFNPALKVKKIKIKYKIKFITRNNLDPLFKAKTIYF